jgi:hypothetical protein
MEQMALGVARETMNVIQARPFDRATAGVPRDSIVPTSEFEEKSSIWSSNLDCAALPGGTDECNDVDDFYGDIATVPFTFPTGSFEFEVNINVQYVNADLNPTGGTKSDRKQIILEVQDNPSSGNPRLPEPIKYTEVVSYP